MYTDKAPKYKHICVYTLHMRGLQRTHPAPTYTHNIHGSRSTHAQTIPNTHSTVYPHIPQGPMQDTKYPYSPQQIHFSISRPQAPLCRKTEVNKTTPTLFMDTLARVHTEETTGH